MLECPTCRHNFKEASFEGWLVFGTGYCQVDRDGNVAVVGPIVPMISIEPGRKLLESDLLIRCPHCDEKHPAKAHALIRPCDFTGGNAKVPVVLFTGATVIVAEDVADWVRQHLTVQPDPYNDNPEIIRKTLVALMRAYS